VKTWNVKTWEVVAIWFLLVTCPIGWFVADMEHEHRKAAENINLNCEQLLTSERKSRRLEARREHCRSLATRQEDRPIDISIQRCMEEELLEHGEP
jgi:hypothetical protein